jgi:hypothetical protein
MKCVFNSTGQQEEEEWPPRTGRPRQRELELSSVRSSHLDMGLSGWMERELGKPTLKMWGTLLVIQVCLWHESKLVIPVLWTLSVLGRGWNAMSPLALTCWRENTRYSQQFRQWEAEDRRLQLQTSHPFAGRKGCHFLEIEICLLIWANALMDPAVPGVFIPNTRQASLEIDLFSDSWVGTNT